MDAGSPRTLDDAWKAAEAALPEGWVMWTLGPGGWSAHYEVGYGVRRVLTDWEAMAAGPRATVKAGGRTPVEALLALAARLNEGRDG